MNVQITYNPREATLITHGGPFDSSDILSGMLLGKIFNGYIYRSNEFEYNVNFNPDAIIFKFGFDLKEKTNSCHRDSMSFRTPILIWNQFGHEIIQKELNLYDCDVCLIEEIYVAMKKRLIIPIDFFSSKEAAMTRKYTASTDINKIICSFNPNWNEPQDFDKSFIEALNFLELVFNHYLARIFAKIKSKKIVEKAIKDSTNDILILNQFVPWIDTLLDSSNPKAKNIKFCIYPSIREEGYNWQCVPLYSGAKFYRKEVPEDWRGLDSYQLRELTGIKTANFCHYSGYLGGARTLEDTINFVKLAMNS